MKRILNMKLTGITFSILLMVMLFPAFTSISYAGEDDDPVLLSIAGEDVKLSEFLRVYQKNNLKDHVLDKAALEDYLELYINFKLKVREAIELKMDTVPAFITELDGYRKQLAEPYLTDSEMEDWLINEAYERMLTDIRAGHILFRVVKDANPEDTLAAYKKAVIALRRILDGEDFGDVAADVSEDPSARDREAGRSQPSTKGNRGDLGFFSAFDMVYPFENGAFNTPVGEVSQPIRTDYGYHLIKVYTKQKAMGKAQVAHIYVKFPADSSAEDSAKARHDIWEAYNELEDGAIFDDVVMEYSDDKSTAKKGGVLSWFGSNRMVPEFIENVFSLENKGDISEPFTTNYGWHIIKIIDRTEPGSFEDEEPDLRKKLAKDARSHISKDAFINKVKGQYNFKGDITALQEFYKVVDDSIFIGGWNPDRAKDLNKVLFVLDEKDFNQQDFVAYLDITQRNRTHQDIDDYVDEHYEAFVSKECLKYKDKHLEDEYPAFKSLMKEYHDGILLFELTDQKVWTKAVKDTNGLDAYHIEHNENYMWGERLDVSEFLCENEKTANKARKMASKMMGQDFDPSKILKTVNKDTIINLIVQRSKYSKGDNEMIDNLVWEAGITGNTDRDEKIVFSVVHGKIPPEPKKLSEARGLITADYQNYLEKDWIKELRGKYNYTVFINAFDNIKVE